MLLGLQLKSTAPLCKKEERKFQNCFTHPPTHTPRVLHRPISTAHSPHHGGNGNAASPIRRSCYTYPSLVHNAFPLPSSPFLSPTGILLLRP
ncbi:hypothetical protein DAI22_03g420050 [Oryza sativa Japonica Group]|nr:hypothetical protein DAI22_03g420050 [Oryza sativa Japonica Group]